MPVSTSTTLGSSGGPIAKPSPPTPRSLVKFLDRYTEDDIRKICTDLKFKDGPNFGKTFSDLWESWGFGQMIIDIDASDSFVHRIQIFDSRPVSLSGTK